MKRTLHNTENYIEIPIKLSKKKINNLYLHFLVTKKKQGTESTKGRIAIV